MSKVLAIAVLAALFLRWLVLAQVVVLVDGVPVGVPVLAITLVVAVVVMAGLGALIVYQTRAEQAMLAAWQARSAAIRIAGGAR
jgi:hypothetical protein